MAACRMNCGVTSSGSPNQNAAMSARPMPALATSRIFDARSRWIAGRALGEAGCIVVDMYSVESLLSHGTRQCAVGRPEVERSSGPDVKKREPAALRPEGG